MSAQPWNFTESVSRFQCTASGVRQYDRGGVPKGCLLTEKLIRNDDGRWEFGSRKGDVLRIGVIHREAGLVAIQVIAVSDIEADGDRACGYLRYRWNKRLLW